VERGNDTQNIHYPALILILQDLVERVEQLEKDNELLKSYVWDGNGK
jgi:cell shape-determining protein MreC